MPTPHNGRVTMASAALCEARRTDPAASSKGDLVLLTTRLCGSLDDMLRLVEELERELAEANSQQ